MFRKFTQFAVLSLATLSLITGPALYAAKDKSAAESIKDRVKEAEQFKARAEELKDKVQDIAGFAAEKQTLGVIGEKFETLKKDLEKAKTDAEKEALLKRFETYRAQAWERVTNKLKENSTARDRMKEMGLNAQVVERSAEVVPATAGDIKSLMEAASDKIKQVAVDGNGNVDKEMAEQLSDGALHLAGRVYSKLLKQQEKGKTLDAKTVEAARKSILESITIAAELANQAKQSRLVEKAGSTAATKALENSHKAGEATTEHATSSDFKVDPKIELTRMARTLLEHGTVEDAENFAKLKESGGEALLGMLRIGGYYHEASIVELEDYLKENPGIDSKLAAKLAAGEHLTPAERESVLKKLSEGARQAIHEKAKIRVGMELKKLSGLDETDFKTLCGGAAPCASSAFCK